jgi:hypothetical protein
MIPFIHLNLNQPVSGIQTIPEAFFIPKIRTFRTSEMS